MTGFVQKQTILSSNLKDKQDKISENAVNNLQQFFFFLISDHHVKTTVIVKLVLYP